MKHANSEMIKAVLDNTELVIFCEVVDHENEDGNYWAVSNLSSLVSCFNKFFVCLPQHKEACLHWLNGGDVQHDDCIEGWATMENINEPMDINEPLWSKTCRLMTEHLRFRIKPKKEKRWIGYCANTNQTFPHPQKSKDVAEDYAMRNYGYEIGKWQFLEIEIEVEV